MYCKRWSYTGSDELDSGDSDVCQGIKAIIENYPRYVFIKCI